MSSLPLTLGFVPLIDCAPLVIARELGFAEDEGLALTLLPQPSWSALRDMLALGHLDAAQMLSPMPVAMSLGWGGLAAQVDALMVLSVNGTVFGLSRDFAARLPSHPGFGDPVAAARALAQAQDSPIRVGVPFPYSMHRLLLDYWVEFSPELDASQFEIVTVPPPRMADAVAQGTLDAFWVGEPWGSAAVARGVADLVLPGRAIWAFAPEKVLAARHGWIAENPETVSALIRAVHTAAHWLDTPRNTSLAVEILARSEHLDLPRETIDPALSGQLSPALGHAPVPVDRFLMFHRNTATFPWRSQAAWIAARLGADAAEQERARDFYRSDIYRDSLGPIGVDLPGASEKVEGAMRHATAVASSRGHMILGPDAFFDGGTFDRHPKT
ncbi:nitrate transporter [Jannaschia pagri]|uniref:Nitrate transporter n=1 Tax=Jannaschia pagri TaxID=2829797 RepID=A0ABQ4NHN4_9RHOB|nr:MULTISPECIES: CmpA/NrtA family ABC transporter substrate-binding protein [unclassified Jannaschia]GIT90098.1 nitrate transporter [Jannaschia sp. AI_61]GIT93796.1 nitrate transporter [Jannaschia sp. AI_62]